MKGQIVKIVRDLHYVRYGDDVYPCKCRGKIRNLKQIPLVGDFCIFDKDKLTIESILDRKNEFSRPPVANIDQAIIVMILQSKIIMQPQPLPKAIFMAEVLVIVVYLRSLSYICVACHIFAKQMCD